MTSPVDMTDPDESDSLPRPAELSRPTDAAEHGAAEGDAGAGPRDGADPRGAPGSARLGAEDESTTVPTADETQPGNDMQPGDDMQSALARASAREIAAAVCPYLASAGGAWRMAVPSRDHRCVGLQPPVPQPPDKQRRHCLSAAHVECGIYRAARDVRTVALAGSGDPARILASDASRRPLPRTAPILLEPPRLLDQASRLRLDRAPGQLALVALMVVAFAVVGLSRLSGTPAAQPSASLIAVLPSRSIAPRSPTPTVVPSPSASASAPASAQPSFRTTYTVKKGDTLSTVATRFKTTSTAIRRLNNLKSSTLRIGQVLKIP